MAKKDRYIRQKIAVAGVDKERGYLYYLNKQGNIERLKMTYGRKSENHKPEEVFKTNVTREAGWLYFIDKDGDVSRVESHGRVTD